MPCTRSRPHASHIKDHRTSANVIALEYALFTVFLQLRRRSTGQFQIHLLLFSKAIEATEATEATDEQHVVCYDGYARVTCSARKESLNGLIW